MDLDWLTYEREEEMIVPRRLLQWNFLTLVGVGGAYSGCETTGVQRGSISRLEASCAACIFTSLEEQTAGQEVAAGHARSYWHLHKLKIL